MVAEAEAVGQRMHPLPGALPSQRFHHLTIGSFHSAPPRTPNHMEDRTAVTNSMVGKAGAVGSSLSAEPEPLHRSTTALSPAVEWLLGAKPYVSLWSPITRDATDSLRKSSTTRRGR
jgi:hypothetical protein